MVSANGACPAFLTASAIDDAGIKNTHGAKIDGAFHIIGFTVTNGATHRGLHRRQRWLAERPQGLVWRLRLHLKRQRRQRSAADHGCPKSDEDPFGCDDGIRNNAKWVRPRSDSKHSNSWGQVGWDFYFHVFQFFGQHLSAGGGECSRIEGTFETSLTDRVRCSISRIIELFQPMCKCVTGARLKCRNGGPGLLQ